MPAKLSEARFDLQDAAMKAYDNKQMAVDLGGHFKNCSVLDSFFRSQLFDWLIFPHWENSVSSHLLNVLKDKKKANKWFPFPVRRSFECTECGQPVELEFNGKDIRCKNTCPYPEGMVYEIELNIPSGKMVVANDLRDWWKVVGSYNINSAEGCRKTTLKYAEAGMAHAFVGNTCPDVYRVKDNEFVIGVTGGKSYRNPVKNSKTVATICTDLWWYSIVDHDDFVRRGLTLEEVSGRVVKCQPGVYRFKHIYHTQDRDSSEPLIFTQVDWIRKPDPVVDHAAYYNGLNFTAGQIIGDFMSDEDINFVHNVQQAADYVMCVLGSGMEYHKNGWRGCNGDLTMDAPEVKIPVFKKKYRWYPLCDESFIVRASSMSEEPDWMDRIAPKDIILNPSFVELAFNILHCMAKYGVDDPRDGDHTRKCAVEALNNMLIKYPDQVPAYVKRYIKSEEK